MSVYDDWYDFEDETEIKRYEPGRFNIVPSVVNDEYDYFDFCRGPYYDVFYYTDKGTHLFVGAMQCHCDHEGEFKDCHVLPLDTSNALEAILTAFNNLYGKDKMDRWFRVVSID